VINRPKNTGRRNKKNVVNWLKHQGIQAFRVPGSGAFQGLPACDVVAKIVPDFKMEIEVKYRKNPPKVFTGWIKGNDVLILIPERTSIQESFFFGPMRTLQEFILKISEQAEKIKELEEKLKKYEKRDT
jgi:Holliday junction resolvase